MSQHSFDGRVAVVTGAGRGIGRGYALLLAERGADVVVNDLGGSIEGDGEDDGPASSVAAEIVAGGGHSIADSSDVATTAGAQKLVDAAVEQFGRLDILINNAGIAHPSGPARELPSDDWNDVIATNLTGLFLVTKAALPLMKRGAIIVNNLSIAAKRVFPGSAAYNASKHGALGFTDTLREELRDQGIRVIALLPGATNTEIWKTLWADAPRDKMMSPGTVARALIDSLKLPPDATLEELIIRPTAGSL